MNGLFAALAMLAFLAPIVAWMVVLERRRKARKSTMYWGSGPTDGTVTGGYASGCSAGSSGCSGSTGCGGGGGGCGGGGGS